MYTSHEITHYNAGIGETPSCFTKVSSSFHSLWSCRPCLDRINPPTNDHASGGLTSECHLIPAVTLVAPTLLCLTSHLGFWDLKSGPHVSVTSTLTTELSLQPQWVCFFKSRRNNLPFSYYIYIPLFLFKTGSLNVISLVQLFCWPSPITTSNHPH